MTRYQYVTGYYNGQRKSIDMWCRTGEGRKVLLSVMGFEPYMYVPENEPVPDENWITRVQPNYDFYDGSKVKKVVVIDPLQVLDHRGDFTVAHEAKVRFVQRGLIDMKIRSCFETDVRSGVVPYTLLTPVDDVIMPLVVYMDIETKSKARFPNWRNPTDQVIAVSFWDTLHKIYITVMIDMHQNIGKVQTGNWMQIRVGTYRELVDICCGYLDRMKGDILTGWNISFDINYFNAWMKVKFDMELPLSGYEIFDLAEAYKKIRPSLGNRLKEVVVREKLIKPEDMVAKEFHIELYDNPATRSQFMRYNKEDVEFCVKLDRGFTNIETGNWVQYDIINRFWEEKNFAGLSDISDTLSHVKRHDVLWLRQAYEMGIVLPSAPDKTPRSELEYGGVVFNPPPGLYSDLTVLDMSRYYPNILRTFAKETSPDVWGKLGPGVIGHLWTERDRYEKELENLTPGTPAYDVAYAKLFRAKTFLSGAWGYFVYPGSRVYDPVKGDFVLKTAGDGLELMRKEAAYLGHETKYGDTDSIFLESEIDDVPNLVDALNDVLKNWALEKGVPPDFKIKEDRYARNTLFVRSEQKDIGVKKRYGQWVIRDGGKKCDYIMIKGFEYARGNTSEITRGIQKMTLESVLRMDTGGLIKYLQDEIEKIRSGGYDWDDITIPVNLGMKIEDAKSGEYYFGAQYNNLHIKEEIIGGDRVRFFKTKSMPPGFPPAKGGWISYVDKWNLPKEIEIDMDWLIGRTVRSPIERILEAAGISWMNVLGAVDASDFFQ